LNSGTDFSDFTAIRIEGRESQVIDASTGMYYPLKTVSTRYQISNDMPEDSEIAAIVKAIQSDVQKSMNSVVGTSKVDLDARFSQIRTKETNVANFLASVMARATDADIALLNSGSIRADRILPKGDIRMSDLADLVPMDDSMEVVEITGAQLLQVLENGVSQYPAMEGRFPCVDGVRFAFDPSKPAGSRLVEGSVTVRSRQCFSCLHKRGETPPPPSIDNNSPATFCPLESQRTYTLCTKTYLLKGKDGYDVLSGLKVVRDEEYCPLLPTAVANLFTEIGILRRWTDYTIQGSVIAAAAKFKEKLRTPFVDPFAIHPVVDGRIRNIQIKD
jgi:5'-nucleotidase